MEVREKRKGDKRELASSGEREREREREMERERERERQKSGRVGEKDRG